jgi:hypothetical protein
MKRKCHSESSMPVKVSPPNPSNSEKKYQPSKSKTANNCNVSVMEKMFKVKPKPISPLQHIMAPPSLVVAPIPLISTAKSSDVQPQPRYKTSMYSRIRVFVNSSELILALVEYFKTSIRELFASIEYYNYSSIRTRLSTSYSRVFS